MTKCLTVEQAAEYIHAKSGLTMRATCRTFRHSFTTHLLEGGCGVRNSWTHSILTGILEAAYTAVPRSEVLMKKPYNH